MYFMTQGQRVLILGKTKKLKGVTRHSQASMFVFADEQSEEPGEGSPMTAKEALGPLRPISQKSPFKNAPKRPLRDLTSTNSPAAASSFDGPPSKKHLGAHERTLPDLGLDTWDRDALDKDREARRRRMTETTANGFNKLNSAQSLAYYRRHETEDILNAIYKHKERAAYETYFRDAIDTAHDASIKATVGLPHPAAIAALALAHSVALYGSLDRILVSLGREKSCVPYTEAKTYDILKRIDDTAPALWVNESLCAKGTHLANHASDVHPFYRKFMMEQETRFGHAFVVFDQARQILECSPQPGMPHHCKAANAPSMWFFTNFGTTWVTRAGTEFALKVLGVSTIGGCCSKVGPYRTIDGMARQWGVQPTQIISVPHYDKSTGRNSGSAADMLELSLLKMEIVLRPARAVDVERLRYLEAQHAGLISQTATICPHDLSTSSCKVCSACPHGRVRSRCKDCGGSSICEHGRQRSQCKECGGSQICEHGRQRPHCKECGGSAICEHGREHSKCKDCVGGSICDHGRVRSQCKECGGSAFCEHNRRRSECKECGGASICEHNRRRRQCKECGGGSICDHGRQRNSCVDCTPKKKCTLCAQLTRNKSGSCTSCNKERKAKT